MKPRHLRLLLLLWAPAACTGEVKAPEGNVFGPTQLPGTGPGGTGSGGPGGVGTTPPAGSPNVPGQPSTPSNVGTTPPVCTSPEVGVGRWRRLTNLQYRNTVRDLLGLEADTSGFLLDTTSGPFAANAELPPQSSDIEHYADAAASLATRAVANLPKLACDPKVTGEDPCATKFIADFAARAYRRPPTAEETAALTKVYGVGKEESFTAGIRLVVEAVLQSPSFLYMAEFGAGAGGTRKLSGYEVASRLSYLLWNTMPDSGLINAAASGALDQPDAVAKEAMRLVASPRFTDTVSSFHAQMLGAEKLSQPGVVSKDPAAYPEFNDELKAAMQDETNRFLRDVFTAGDGTITSVFTATHSFPSGPLAKLYGAPAPGAGGRVDFTDGTRYGILTQGSFLASQPSVQTHYQAVLRGKSVRVNVLCQDIAPPPVGVDFSLPPGADKMTQQQLLRIHQENPSCKGCHQLMDNIGFGFENYDGIGRYRTKAADGSMIDASGDVMSSDVQGAFTGPKQLTDKLAQSQEVRACMAKQWFRFTFGREAAEADRCSLASIGAALGAGRGDVRQALIALVKSDAFRYRRGE
jgi:hypothetical protein